MQAVLPAGFLHAFSLGCLSAVFQVASVIAVQDEDAGRIRSCADSRSMAAACMLAVS